MFLWQMALSGGHARNCIGGVDTMAGVGADSLGAGRFDGAPFRYFR
jgi:hypothetical protein